MAEILDNGDSLTACRVNHHVGSNWEFLGHFLKETNTNLKGTYYLLLCVVSGSTGIEMSSGR